MRLRASGRSGPLGSSLEAFRRYHEAGSQLWERQALVRARFVAGDPRRDGHAPGERLLGARDYRILVEGYTFLRRLGHRLRLGRDHDTHILEREPDRLRTVALGLGYEERGRKSPGAGLR